MFFDEKELSQQDDLINQGAMDRSQASVANEALTERLSRLAADFDNFKRRVEIDKRTWYAAAKAEVIEKLLPFLDDLTLAINSQKKINTSLSGVISEEKKLESASSEVISGLELIVQNYLKTLNSLGVTEVRYDFFDPEMHDALGSVAVEGKSAGEIIDVLKRGFLLDKRVLRPAQVIVTKE